MQPPPGLHVSKPGQVCRLQRYLYGLKKTSRQWYDKLSSFLISHGYTQSAFQHSLFLKFSTNTIIALLLYVDDVVLAGNDIHEISRITALLDDTFKIKNLGDLKFFLGLEVTRSTSGIHLCQHKYVLDLLSDNGMLASRPASTPMDYHTHLHSTSRTPLTDPSVYRRLIGRLIYLTTTRSDIAFLVQHLSQFVSVPTTAHHQAAFRVLRYLKGTLGLGIFLSANSSLQLKAFSDSDWAGCIDSRRSVIGFSVYLGSSLISWRSKKQATVSKSSSEVEYRDLASTTCELQWITYLLEDLCVPFIHPALLYCDNQSALQIASNQVFHERTKYIEIDCHIVRDKVKDGFLKLLPIDSSLQLANIYTKVMTPVIFHGFCSKLRLLNIHSQLEGGS